MEYIGVVIMVALAMAGISAWLLVRPAPSTPPIDPLAAALAPLGPAGASLGGPPPLAGPTALLPPPAPPTSATAPERSAPEPPPPPSPSPLRPPTPAGPPEPAAERPSQRAAEPGARRSPIARIARRATRGAVAAGRAGRRVGRAFGGGVARGGRERIEEIVSDPASLLPSLDPRALDPESVVRRHLRRAGDLRGYARDLRQMPLGAAVDRLAGDAGELAAREAIDLAIARVARGASRRGGGAGRRPPPPPRPAPPGDVPRPDARTGAP